MRVCMKVCMKLSDVFDGRLRYQQPNMNPGTNPAGTIRGSGIVDYYEGGGVDLLRPTESH